MGKQIVPTPLTKQDHETRKRFISLRKELSLSRSQLATELGMSARAIHFYEIGARVIPKHVERMMDMLKRVNDLKRIVGEGVEEAVR